MAERSLLDYFVYSAEELRLRARMDQVQSSADDAAAYGAQQAQSTQSLASQVGSLRKDVAKLTVMVSVLAEALAMRGGIDMAWAGPRLQEQLARLDPPKPPAKAPEGNTPYRGDVHPHAEPIAVRMVVCEQCKNKVDATTTYVTELGTLCGACYRP